MSLQGFRRDRLKQYTSYLSSFICLASIPFAKESLSDSENTSEIR